MMRLLFTLLALLSLAVTLTLTAGASPAHAGQTITIDGSSGGGTVNDNVWGNGTPPDGTPLGTPPESATGNAVNINSGGTVAGDGILSNGDVYGGYASSTGSGPAAATGNSVTVNSGGTVIGDIYGGSATSTSGTATASGNSVTISGGTVGAVDGGIVYGGSWLSG